MSAPATDYFELATQQAKGYRDRVVGQYEPGVKVGLTVIGPDNLSRVSCGEATFARCDAEQSQTGVLSVTSRDDGYVLMEYAPGIWTAATCYGVSGDIDYVLYPKERAE